MNSISLQLWVVVTLLGSRICAFGLVLGPLGAVLGCILLLAWLPFGGGYFGLFLPPFCLALEIVESRF